jgi:hypothetical protein
MLLDYLTTSHSRKLLLGLLWKEGKKGSVSYLARESCLGFSTTYEELKHMESAGLAHAVHVKATLVYQANLDYPKAHLLRELLADRSVPQEQPNPEQILADLAALGAPLSAKLHSNSKSPPEKILTHALKVARYNPTVTRVLPLVFAKNKAFLNFDLLKELAIHSGDRRALGFFLDLTFQLSRHAQFKVLAEDLFDNRVKRKESFFLGQPQGKYLKLLEERNTPNVAKKWYFTLNMNLESFETLYNKFA